MNLLQLSLPGIDINDPSKSMSTLLFVGSVAMCVPFIDLSIKIDAGLPLEKLVIDEEDEACRLATFGISEWIFGFFDRIFALFENLPENYAAESNSKRSSEEGVIDMILVRR
jgi:proteasome activator subunit 4